MTTRTTSIEEPAAPAEDAADAPLIDSVGAAIKKLIARGKERGYVTYDELNAALPTDQVSSEQIEDTMATLSELGVNVVEAEDSEDVEAGDAGDSADGRAHRKWGRSARSDRPPMRRDRLDSTPAGHETFSISEILPPHDPEPWPESFTAGREQIYGGEER